MVGWQVPSYLGFASGSLVKNLPAMQEMQFWFLGQEFFPRERNGNSLQYSCLEKSHGQRSHGQRAKSMGVARAGHDLATTLVLTSASSFVTWGPSMYFRVLVRVSDIPCPPCFLSGEYQYKVVWSYKYVHCDSSWDAWTLGNRSHKGLFVKVSIIFVLQPGSQSVKLCIKML